MNKGEAMNTFLCVETLHDEEVPEGVMVIRQPDFIDEIKSCERFKGSFSKTTVNYLRSIASEFGNKYDKEFNPYRNIIPTDFQGVSIVSNEHVSNIVKSMFTSSYPKIFQSYLEYKIKNRPFNCDHLIIVGFDCSLVKQVMESFEFNEVVLIDNQEHSDDKILLPQTDDQELLETLLNTSTIDVDTIKTKKTSKKKSVHP